MRYKIRQLIGALLEAGYACNSQRGKGSHRRFYHPKGKTITICHHDNDDAPPYLVKQVAKAIEAVKGEGAYSPKSSAPKLNTYRNPNHRKENTMSNNKKAQNLARRYVRLVYWSDEDRAYLGSLPEICGPCCDAATPQEVYRMLDEIALGYAEDKLAGRDYGAVPDPGNLTFITNTRRNESVNSGSRVAQIRKRLNVSQAVFAEIMQVNRSAVQKWEDGTRRPSGAASRLLELVSEHPELVLRKA